MYLAAAKTSQQPATFVSLALVRITFWLLDRLQFSPTALVGYIHNNQQLNFFRKNAKKSDTIAIPPWPDELPTTKSVATVSLTEPPATGACNS